MKCLTICAFILSLGMVAKADDDLVATASENSENTQEITGSASNLRPWQEKHQEKRYIGGANYAGVGAYGTGLDTLGAYNGAGYYNPYQFKLGLDGYAGYPGYNGYTGGYGGYAGYGGYGGYGAYSGGYNSHPYTSYYNRLSGAYARPGYSSYASYPSNYYSSGYGSSVIGGGLGALGTPGFVPPIAGAAGYQYGPGISGTVY